MSRPREDSMARREEHDDYVLVDSRCCRIGCISFLVLIGLVLYILVKFVVDLNRSIPNIYVQDFYVPALDKTTAFKFNTSVYVDLLFARKVALTRYSYKDFQMTLSYGMNKDKLSRVGTSMIHGFSMGRDEKRFDVKVEMGAVGLPWDEAVRVVSNHDVVFMAVKLEARHMYVATVMVDASGHMFSNNPIKFDDLSFH